MKKSASIILTALLLITTLSVFALPVFAEEPIECEPTVSQDSTSLILSTAGNYIISEDLDIDFLAIINQNCTLTIPEGVKVTVKLTLTILGKIELAGTLDVSQCFDVPSQDFDRINVSGTGSIIKNNNKGENPGYWDTPTDPKFTLLPGSALSNGSLTVIVGVVCLAVGFLAAMFIFKKEKSPVSIENEK